MNRATKVFFLSFLFISVCAQCFAYDQLYVWQRNWDKHIEEAVASVMDTARYFIVLCGDMKFEGEKPVITPVNIKWDYLFQTESEATLAFRINAKASKFFATTEINKLADSIGSAISKIIKTAPSLEGGSSGIIGVQIDYDCPTSKLSDYVKFIKLIKKRFKDLEISITTLPAWLDSADFPALAASCDYYVLQVHSFKVPDTLEEALKPFSSEVVYPWIKKASLIGHPFYVSLPTYGYEVSFTGKGKFLGIRAETSQATYKPGTKHAIVVTDPWKILSFLNEMDKEKPKHLLGFCWFRLPLVTDEFNWSLDTLRQIMDRQAPRVSMKSEIDSPQPGLFEIYVTNDGYTNVFKDIRFKVTWPKDIQVIHDVVSGYKEESLPGEAGVTIIGMPPKAGNRQLVAWLRSGWEDINLFKVGEVEGYEK